MGSLNDDIKFPVNKIQERGGDNGKYKLPKKIGYNEIQNIGEMTLKWEKEFLSCTSGCISVYSFMCLEWEIKDVSFKGFTYSAIIWSIICWSYELRTN